MLQGGTGSRPRCSQPLSLRDTQGVFLVHCGAASLLGALRGTREWAWNSTGGFGIGDFREIELKRWGTRGQTPRPPSTLLRRKAVPGRAASDSVRRPGIRFQDPARFSNCNLEMYASTYAGHSAL